MARAARLATRAEWPDPPDSAWGKGDRRAIPLRSEWQGPYGQPRGQAKQDTRQTPARAMERLEYGLRFWHPSISQHGVLGLFRPEH